MLLKKRIFLISMGLLAFASAFAAKDNLGYLPPPPVYSGLYFEAQGGYAMRDWAESAAFHTYISDAQGGGPPFGAFENGKSSRTLDGILGYQWNQYFAAEVGAIWFPRMVYQVPRGFRIGAENTIAESTWIGYVAFKFAFPIVDGFYAFSKFGAASINEDTKFSFLPVRGLVARGSYWAPTFAVGVQYYFSWNWSVNVQYMHANGFEEMTTGGAFQKAPSPHYDMFTLGLAYKLAI